MRLFSQKESLLFGAARICNSPSNRDVIATATGASREVPWISLVKSSGNWWLVFAMLMASVGLMSCGGGGGGGGVGGGGAGTPTATGRLFFDGFETYAIGIIPETLWAKDDFHNLCQVVASADDGVTGPRSGGKMLRCNWNGMVGDLDPAHYESLTINTDDYDDELFIRAWIRIDQNMDVGAKLLRIFFFAGGIYHDLFDSTGSGGGAGLKNEGALSPTAGGNLITYFGNAFGDNTHADKDAWHKIEYYIKQSTGTIKVWHDEILVRDDTGLDFENVKWSPFYITSNPQSPPFDATNYIYFDDFEVYSDRGTGATGLMSDATIQN